jgi:hypothetical protein
MLHRWQHRGNSSAGDSATGFVCVGIFDYNGDNLAVKPAELTSVTGLTQKALREGNHARITRSGSNS